MRRLLELLRRGRDRYRLRRDRRRLVLLIDRLEVLEWALERVDLTPGEREEASARRRAVLVELSARGWARAIAASGRFARLVVDGEVLPCAVDPAAAEEAALAAVGLGPSSRPPLRLVRGGRP